MPGPGIHIAVADRVAAHLNEIKVWPYRSAHPGPNRHLPPELAVVANRHRNYYALGAIGPWLTPFWSPRMSHQNAGRSRTRLGRQRLRACSTRRSLH